MSVYCNVTEQDLTNLRKLSEQQRNQRALKIKNRNSKQTHDYKLSESLSPIAKRLDKVNESTQKLGEVIKVSQPETPQLAIENPQQQLPKQNNQDDSQPGILYDVSLQNTITNMKDKQKGFLKITEDEDGQTF